MVPEAGNLKLVWIHPIHYGQGTQPSVTFVANGSPKLDIRELRCGFNDTPLKIPFVEFSGQDKSMPFEIDHSGNSFLNNNPKYFLATEISGENHGREE